jgi:hypothetical protein
LNPPFLARNLHANLGMTSLRHQIDRHAPRAQALCEALRRKAAGLFDEDVIAACTADTATYQLQRDPASGRDALMGEWLDARGQRLGMLVFHAEGNCFGEYDIVRMHPTDRRWFVEAVEAWCGPPDAADGGAPRAELRLLEAP